MPETRNKPAAVGQGPDLSWSATVTQTLERLQTSVEGLSSREAAARLAVYGPNRLEDRPRRALLFNFVKRFGNPLVLILLSAAVVSAITGDSVSFLIIIGIVLLSVLLDFAQEYRAENAAEKLRQRVALMVHAIRDGKSCEIGADTLVPGDILLLAAGDMVPADCRLIESKDLFINEALLTGESYPAEKRSVPLSEGQDASAAFPATAVFMGSSVVSGTAKAAVAFTGRMTQLGRIAHSLRREPPPTAFALGIRDFGLLVVRLTVALVLFVLMVNLLFQRPLLESFLFALALAVGLTPELLPMIVSVTLARGAMRMADKHVIVKRLSAIHDLGSMDVLCSDKTGTLTEAKVAFVREVDLAGNASGNVLDLAYLNAAFETGLKSPLDDAILAAKRTGLDGWKKIDEVPFDFERRRVSVLAEKDGRRVLIVKGAPEDVLKLASRYQRAGETSPAPLDEAARASAHSVLAELGNQGFRVLGVASRDVEPLRDHADLEDETDLIFAGFATFLDPPKESAGTALALLAALGISLKILSGDNEHVTENVCRKLGLEVKDVVTGSELAALSDEALSARVEEVNLFCRVTPAQKSRIIGALRRRGHIVGYLGDGINDAPSLRTSDVGISVESAVDVAKEAADMILLRKDLDVLAEGVREGRRTFANAMKYIMMGTSSNFGNMFSMAGAALFLPFLPMLPVQILLNNLLYDFSEIAIPMDRVDEAMIERPHHWDIRFIQNFMLVLGTVSSLFDYLTFGVLIWIFHANEALFQTGWFVESLVTQVLVIFLIRTRGNPLNSRPHPQLTATSLLVAATAILLPYTFIGHWFGLIPLPLELLLALLGMTGAYLLAAEFAKRAFYARFAGR